MTRRLTRTYLTPYYHHSYNELRILSNPNIRMSTTEPFPLFDPALPPFDLERPPRVEERRRKEDHKKENRHSRDSHTSKDTYLSNESHGTTSSQRSIIRPTAIPAAVITIEPNMNYRDGLPPNATVILGPPDPPHDALCTHGFSPSAYPRHVYKCYVVSAAIAGRFPMSEYMDICARIDQLVDDQLWEGESNPHVSMKNVSRIKDSLDLARNKVCFRCQERRRGRGERWKPGGFLGRIREGFWKGLGLGCERRVCEKCQGHWR